MLITKQLDSLTSLGSYSSALAETNVSRHLHFLSIAKIPVLQYVVKLLIITYWVCFLNDIRSEYSCSLSEHISSFRSQQQLPNFIGLDLDRIYGCLLILCQMSWPSEKGIIVEVLKRIRAQRTFTFSLFFKYVINLELLEEFTYMYGNEQDLVKLDLTGTGHTPK